MKKLLIFLFVCIANAVFAQQEEYIDLEDLEIPTAPGFILLDQAPSSIETPNNPMAFNISILNAFTESSGLPQNYAIEFTPFWFFKHPKMSLKKYVGYDDGDDEVKQNPLSSLKMISLSLAYINKVDSLSLSPMNNVSFGARTTLLKVRSKKNLKIISDDYSKSVNLMKKINSLIVDSIGPGDPTDSEGYKIKHAKVYQFYIDSLQGEVLENRSNLSESIIQKPIFAVDIASAYSTSFTENNFSSQKFGRFGAWLTLNYSILFDEDGDKKRKKEENEKYLNIYGVGRFLQEGSDIYGVSEISKQNFIDVGGKVEFELHKFSISYEYIHRSGNSVDTYRSSGQIKYRIAESLMLSGAFGKNFTDNNNLISILGINWGISTGNEKAHIETK